MVSFPKYDSYKSSGVEWLGDIPEGWEVKKLKFLANQISLKINLKNKEVNYLGLENIESGTGKLIKTELVAEGIANTFKKNDVLFGKLRPYLAKVHLAKEKGFCTTEALVLRFSQHTNFYFYLLISQIFISLVNSSVYGSKMPRASWDFIGSQILPVPPLPEQIRIAEYLDKKTSEIDQAISKKYRLIELLEEQKTIIINQAVTKGLNPNTPMKDSGIEWLGSIPEGWEVRRLKSYAMVKRGASPRPIINPRYFDDNGEYGWVRIEDVTKSNKYLLETKQYLSKIGVKYSVKQNEGDLFLSIAGSVGKPIISKIKCCIHDGFVWFKWFDIINKDFLFYIFLSGLPFVGLGKQGTQLNLNTTMIGNIKIPAPPLPEQIQIAEYLDIKTAEIEYLKEKTQQQIDKLTEFKQILIANAVTGKIKVV